MPIGSATTPDRKKLLLFFNRAVMRKVAAGSADAAAPACPTGVAAHSEVDDD
jgi:hypothetical protein